MKSVSAFFFAAFFAGTSLAQDQIQKQPTQPQSLPQGWYPQNSGITGTLNHVFFKNRDSGWATAGYTFTISTIDGGNSWQKYSDSIAVLGFIGSFGYGSTIRGTGWVATTTNNGLTWEDDSVFEAGLNAVFFYSSSQGFATRGYDIAETFDGGKSWMHVTSPIANTYHFVFFDSLNIFAGGTTVDNVPPFHDIAGLALSTDGGKSWKQLLAKLSSGLNDIVALDPNTLIEVGADILRSKNRGNSWDSITILPSRPLNLILDAVSATEGHNITAVGTQGIILRSIDSGTTWIRQNSLTNIELYDVSFVDSLTGWAVGP